MPRFSPTVNQTYRKLIISRLTGEFRSSTTVIDADWQEPGPGEAVVRNRYAGCNAIFDKNLCRNKIRYVDVVPPYDMGIESIGEIVALGPDSGDFAIGDAVATVQLGTGYREFQLAGIERLVKVRAASPEILTIVPTGVSAYVGLYHIAGMQGGETVAVSAAAGGIGHIVVQLARLAGCHVIGITGSANKRAMLQSIGCDRVIDYRNESLRRVLESEYPRGLDIAYDTVGGEVFDAFVDHLAQRGRVIISGHTSDFDQPVEDVPQPRIYRKLYWKSASVRAFQNQAFPEYQANATHKMLALYYRGDLKPQVDPTPFVGLESVADAVDHMLAGRNIGKVVIRIP
ncbi:MAG TPA: zinc-binding dehydrogenase [Steroidobacteraceae bacterium]|nr:zinc-binding dehydrogenase [Steroidobacteraceae bacterium]HRX88388.1 zinc-binding dehydrogenase [Steroidobacteraceae bacterium]